MRIHNHLPLLVECLGRWEKLPTQAQFVSDYYAPLAEQVGIVFDDRGTSFYGALHSLDWAPYRALALRLKPDVELARLRRAIDRVEGLLGVPLQGEAVLFGAFCLMDGYARFERGKHCVFLGVDESHEQGSYLDILEAHELTHVVRESRPEVWAGWGLHPADLTHDGFNEEQRVVEHLMNEGFACVVSELAVPGESPDRYCYQTPESLAAVLKNAGKVDEVVHAELRLDHAQGDFGRLYAVKRYGAGMPSFTHYVWAWQWAKHVLFDVLDGDARKLAQLCSKELVEDALAFQLPRSL